MSPKTSRVLLGEDLIGNVSAYTALPAVICPSCSAKLHRIFNTTTEWRYVCQSEHLLIDPTGEKSPVKISIE